MNLGVRSMLTMAVVASFVAGAFVASPELRAYAANTVGSSDIIDNSILSVDLKDGEVKNADIAANAITTSKIVDNSIRASDIAADAVGASEIRTNSVAETDIAGDAVTSAKIAPNTITAADIGPDAVSGSEIAGTSKLIFHQVTLPSGSTVGAQQVICFGFPVSGLDGTETVLATPQNNSNNELILYGANLDFDNQAWNVDLCMKNDGNSQQTVPTGFRVAIMIYRIGAS